MASWPERRGLHTLDQYSTAPLFNAKAVARQTGVPAPTFRAWERRYGILTPQRGSNDYRLYSERDIAMVRWLREEVESGMTISHAIALLRSLTLVRPAPEQHSGNDYPAARPDVSQHQDLAEPKAQVLLSNAAARIQETESQTSQLATLADDLLEACIRLDEGASQRVLASIFAIFSIEQAITDLLQPVLVRMGERWQTGQLSITVEHFATAMICCLLEALYHAQLVPTSGPLVLVGCAPGEQHELGALILALLLRRQYPALRVIYLGQNVEPEHLLATIQTEHPAVICLSAALPERRPAIAALARQISTLPLEPRPVLVYGGRAFAQEAEEIEGVFLGTQAIQAIAPIEYLCTHRPFLRS